MRIAGLITIFLFCCTLPAPGQSREKNSYEAYRLIRTRNIFDPNRLAPRPEPSRERSSSPRSRNLSLTGTMVADGKALAFFGGSRGDGRVIGAGEKISDFTVKSIAPLQVELEKDGKVTTLVVGRQLSYDSNGIASDEPAGREEAPTAETAPSTSNAPGAAPAPSQGGPSTAPSNDKNEILRRMMERRQQQMSK
jgi:hypothetical protein